MITIIFVLCLSQIADPTEKSSMKDEDNIQGTWQLVSGERHGKDFSDELVKNVKLIFSGATLTTKNKDQANEAKFTLHPTTTPKGIDLDMDGSLGLGIYKLDGDSLTILHGEVGDERPKNFDAKETETRTLLVLKREKK